MDLTSDIVAPCNEEGLVELVCAPLRARQYLKSIGVIIHKETYGQVALDGEAFVLPVAVFSHDELFKAVGQKPFVRVYECRVDDHVYPFFAPTAGGATIADPPLGISAAMMEQNDSQKTLIPLFLEFLEEVATNILGGMRIVLHPRIPSAVHAPIKDKEDVIHIFLECTPTTWKSYSNPDMLCGIDVLGQVGLAPPCLTPSPRRGYVLSDGKTDVVQILNNNIYILFDPSTLLRLGVHSALTIFRKVISLAVTVTGWMSRDKLIAEHELENPADGSSSPEEDLLALAEAYIAQRRKGAARDISRLAEKITEQEDALRATRKEYAVVKRLYAMLEANNFAQHEPSRLIEDYPRIVAHPLVRSAKIVPEAGVEVRTKDIVILHDGQHYSIGNFTICFGLEDGPVIWAEESFHPTGEPHPHLSAHNGPCFGNIGEAIDDALLDCRYADALEYILLWLTSYSPELVVWHKIEEWPIDGVLVFDELLLEIEHVDPTLEMPDESTTQKENR